MSYYERVIATDPAMPALTGPTLDDAVRIVADWDDLSARRRRDLASALAAVRRMCERYDEWRARERTATTGASLGIAPVAMDCAVLNERLFHRPVRAYGLHKDRFANIRSELRFILRRLGRHAPAEQGVAPNPAWRRLHAALPSVQRQAALTGFFRFCSREAIAPDQVTSETVVQFEAWLVANTLSKLQNRRHSILGAWNWAVDNVPGWPRQKLRSSSGRTRYTLPFSAYPASFQADVERFATRISGGEEDAIFGNVFAVGDGAASLPAPRPVRATTVRSRLFQIRMAAAALVLSGTPAEAITSLRDLVEPVSNAHAIIRFFYARSGRRRGSNAGNVAEALRQIALYHCRLAPDDAARIAGWARKVGRPSQASMTRKNLARLRDLIVPETRAMLLHLPQHLMRMAAEQTEHPTRAVRLALRAVALELLLVFPMRLSSLRRLRLDENLHRRDPGHRRRVTHIHLAEWETKNAIELDWPLPCATSNLLDLYLAGTDETPFWYA